MKTYIGIDLGGTNVRIGKVDEEGKVLYQAKSPSYAQEGPEVVMANVIKMISEVPGLDEVKGIGLGVPGPCDTVNGRMTLSSNLPGFTGYPIVKQIEDKFHIPTFIDNDANVAGLAEALVGAGKGLPVVYYTTLSTGIGGALIANGRVVSGKNGYAGEVANIIIDKRREKINHLNAGAVENEASGTAVVRKARKMLNNPNILHAGEVFDLAVSGDPVAKQLVQEVVEDLAMMYSVIAHVCDPYVFVLGGGMMKSADKFLPQVKERFYQLVHPGMRTTEFVIASLDEPGLIGAAMLPVSRGI